MGKKLLVALTMEGKFAGEGLQNIDEDDDMLSAMARELVERSGIGESADSVWKALSLEHQKLFSAASRSIDDACSIDAAATLLTDPAFPVEQAIGRLAKEPAFQSVLLGGFLDVQRVAAVARDAAVFAQHVERNKAAVILEDDRQRGRVAFGGLHLQDGWCAGEHLIRTLKAIQPRISADEHG